MGTGSGSSSFNDRFVRFVRGHWLDSIGNSIIVSSCKEEESELTAVLTPLIDHPEARDKVVSIRNHKSCKWRCGKARLEWWDEDQHRLVWVTEDGRRSVWSRTAPDPIMAGENGDASAFPWLLNNASPEPWLPLDVPREVLYDGARVAALLDIRQMIGAKSEPQERLTHILMDHDLHPMRGDYLIPGAESPIWQTLQVSDSVRRSIAQRIHKIPHEALSQRVSWSGESEVWVGHHKISCRALDIQALANRWMLQPKDQNKPLEIARLLALYSVFDNPLSNRRNGVHLGLDPELRRQCDYELFASPLNAAVPNGHFASKWPHIEWRFGSVGSYPSVLQILPVDSVVCVNPPFTDAYLHDVMERLGELKLRFRLRIAVPIQEASWRKKLLSSLPSAQLLRTYYDASADHSTDVLHPTLLWEDPRCPSAIKNLVNANGFENYSQNGVHECSGGYYSENYGDNGPLDCGGYYSEVPNPMDVQQVQQVQQPAILGAAIIGVSIPAASNYCSGGGAAVSAGSSQLRGQARQGLGAPAAWPPHTQGNFAPLVQGCPAASSGVPAVPAFGAASLASSVRADAEGPQSATQMFSQGERRRAPLDTEITLRTYMDIEVDGTRFGRIVFGLYGHLCPRTVENFRCLCTGEKGLSKETGFPLHYKDTRIHRIVPGFCIQGGQTFENNDGTGGESIYGTTFEDENLRLKFQEPGVLAMANGGPDTNGSQFFITTCKAENLSHQCVGFGEVLEGFEVVMAIAAVGHEDGEPLKEVVIVGCGEFSGIGNASENARPEKPKVAKEPDVASALDAQEWPSLSAVRDLASRRSNKIRSKGYR